MRHAVRLIVSAVAATAAFLLADAPLSGVELGGLDSAVIAGVVTGAVDVLWWPVLIRLTLPLTGLTLGAAALLLNGAVVLAIGALLPGVHIDGLLDGILVAVIVAAVAALVMSALAIDDGFANCPDIVTHSTYWEESEEVAPFEEKVGSHGGLGGPQAFPFVFAPASLPLPDGLVVGAEPMHRVLRGWLAHLGHEAYAR
jgi:uncharacterized membrane protein YvlD (DUF360 family)